MATTKETTPPDPQKWPKQAIDEKTGKLKKDGRPRLDIDMDMLGTLCEIHCTEQEIAHVFNCSVDTIYRRVLEVWGITFAEYYAQKKADGLQSLRRAQFANALKGNATMQIWLGKQFLGQKDKIEHTGGSSPTDKPIQLDVSNARALDPKELAERAAEIARAIGATKT